jgi:replicative superfamily II helicase
MNYTEGQPMKPEKKSKKVLSVTQSKAKMIEYNIPDEYRKIDFDVNPEKLFRLTIGTLGDYSFKVNQPGITDEELIETKNDLRFSSRFFDTYIRSESDNTLNDYLILLGSATYYLCDLPGNALVLMKRLNNPPDLNSDELEKLLFWLLSSDVSLSFTGIYKYYLQSIIELYNEFIINGTNEHEILNIIESIRELIYANGSDRNLLLVDIISAIIRRKFKNSCWNVLPYYSDMSAEIWKSTIQKNNFIKEFWPAQHLIGEKDILRGKSAIIHMPTSAGKTKTSELIIRSAFLNERTSMAIIIAPFRALCHEIYNDLEKTFKNEKINIYELNDMFQMDIATDQLEGKKLILIVTPEKLFYILNHNKDIALLSNLYIFDEGHQFDNGSRGITYELLLTTLLLIISDNTQKILISAVINNSDRISNWLNKEINVVSGRHLLPTFKTIGFVSWKYELGQIYYVNEENTGEEDFFVPRVIEQIELKKLGKERKMRLFPNKTDGSSISLYLGLKLVSNGSIAIFCGKKDSVNKMCKEFNDIIRRGYNLNNLNLVSNNEEIERLAQLYIMNMGNSSVAANSAKSGIFSHHNGIPHGIRIAVEYAMHENMINFVICTSTLAQGVNLPIRYLIISSFNQAGEYIKVRDFHNLIGRAGRSGMHTEGSILFANPEIYDRKDTFGGKWLWKKSQELLNPEKSEPCSSELLTIFEPLKSTDRKNKIHLKTNDFVKRYLDSPDLIDNLIDKILQDNSDNNFTRANLEQQFATKINIISVVENFMLSNWDELETLKGEDVVSNIVTKTLGYSLAEDDELRNQLSELFNIIEKNIRTKIADSEKRKVYGKTLCGIKEATYIENWFNDNIQALRSTNSEEKLLEVIWNLLVKTYNDKANLKWISIDSLKLIVNAWISGTSYNKIEEILNESKIDIDKVVDICNNKISFNSCLILSAIYEFATQDSEVNMGIMVLLQKLQRRIKYGLPNDASILLYEIGFCDRVIAQDIKNSLNISSDDRLEIIHAIRIKRDLATKIISKYPSYYQMKMDNLVN